MIVNKTQIPRTATNFTRKAHLVSWLWLKKKNSEGLIFTDAAYFICWKSISCREEKKKINRNLFQPSLVKFY